jgi:hypothetical protein
MPSGFVILEIKLCFKLEGSGISGLVPYPIWSPIENVSAVNQIENKFLGSGILPVVN